MRIGAATPQRYRRGLALSHLLLMKVVKVFLGATPFVTLVPGPAALFTNPLNVTLSPSYRVWIERGDDSLSEMFGTLLITLVLNSK